MQLKIKNPNNAVRYVGLFTPPLIIGGEAKFTLLKKLKPNHEEEISIEKPAI